MPPIQLPTSSNPGRYGHDGPTRIINAHAEARGREGKSGFGLYVSDGLKDFSTLADGGVTRGMLVSGASLYTVSAAQVFKTDVSGASDAIGGFAGTGHVWMEVNQRQPAQIVLVSDGNRAIIENDVVSPITDPDLKPPIAVVSLNQRAIHAQANGQFQWSDPNQWKDYNSLNSAVAEYAPDGLVGAKVRGTELLLFGPKTIEPWYDAATPEAADTFQRSGSVIVPGCLSGPSIAFIENVVIYVALDGTVRMLNGYQAQKISNGAVEDSIRKTANKANIKAHTYAYGDKSWYVISGDDFTWSYDFADWTERESYELNRWRVYDTVEFNGKIIAGGFGKLFELDRETYDEAGDPLVMEVHIPLHAYPQRVQLDELRVDTIPGQGTLTQDPRIMARFSKDGGKTWGSQRRIGMGKIGEYFRQVRMNRLGQSKEDGFVIALSASADVVRAIMAANGQWQVLNR